MPHNYALRCRDGGIGRRTGLKIPRWKQRAGSIPAPGTNEHKALNKIEGFFYFRKFPQKSVNSRPHKKCFDNSIL